MFAKAPQAGLVKTRLVPVLHAREAADLQRNLLLDTVDIVESTGWDAWVAFAPSTARRTFERLLGARRRLLAQAPGDLGARLADATAQVLGGSSGRPVIVVGTDCPALGRPALIEAAQELVVKDVVVGPALDGGYYLIGLKRPRPELFSGIAWGTDGVLEETRQRIEAAGLSAAWLEPARDLDTPEDLFEWYAGARSGDMAERYPRTWHLLHSMLPPRRLSALEMELRGEPRG